MRRAVPSFTVEVRRRPRLAITSNPHVQSSETKSPQAGFDRESHRVAAAAFEARKVDPSPVDVESSPGGRILPSLVPEESLRRTLRDAAPTAAESDPPSRPPKRRDQASKSPRNSGFSSAANAPLADGLSPKSRQPSNVQSDEGAGVSPRVETTEQSQVVGDSGGLALGAKARRRDKGRDLSRRRRGQAFASRAAIRDRDGLTGHASFESRRSFTARSKANHHGSLCLR